jgi:predicted  nucleic acid-binding Zn-ribbon protein
MLVLIIVIIVIAALIISSQNKIIANQELSISKLRQAIAGYEGQIRQLNIKAEKFDQLEDQVAGEFLESKECKEYKTELRQLNQQIEQLNKEISKYTKRLAESQNRCFQLQDEIQSLESKPCIIELRKKQREKEAQEPRREPRWDDDNWDYSAIK